MRALLIAAVLALFGCTAVPMYVDRAAAGYDAAEDAALLWQCQGGSRGSLIRNYAYSEERWAAWLELCGYANRRTLPRPVDPEFK